MSHDVHSLSLIQTVLEKLRVGENVDSETLHHLASCEQCADALQQVRRLDQLLANEPAAVEAHPGLSARVLAAMSSERTVRAARLFVASIAILAITAIVIVWTVYAADSRSAERNLGINLGYLFLLSLGPGYGLSMIRQRPIVPSRASVALFVLAFALTPVSMRIASSAIHQGLHVVPWMLAIVAFSGFVCGFVARGGGLPFKRIRKGRFFSGVALGLAPVLGIRVGWIRLVLVVLLIITRWPAILLYALLDVSMLVHPEDRPKLRRFRFRRWLRPAA